MTNENITNTNEIDDTVEKLSKLYPSCSVTRLPDGNGISIKRRGEDEADHSGMVITETEDESIIESDFSIITINHSGIFIKIKEQEC